MDRRCQEPGCDRALGPQNQIGWCIEHRMHSPHVKSQIAEAIRKRRNTTEGREAYNAYMREYQRKRREEAKACPTGS